MQAQAAAVIGRGAHEEPKVPAVDGDNENFAGTPHRQQERIEGFATTGEQRRPPAKRALGGWTAGRQQSQQSCHEAASLWLGSSDHLAIPFRQRSPTAQQRASRPRLVHRRAPFELVNGTWTMAQDRLPQPDGNGRTD